MRVGLCLEVMTSVIFPGAGPWTWEGEKHIAKGGVRHKWKQTQATLSGHVGMKDVPGAGGGAEMKEAGFWVEI